MKGLSVHNAPCLEQAGPNSINQLAAQGGAGDKQIHLSQNVIWFLLIALLIS
jgi:hypothetical protein